MSFSPNITIGTLGPACHIVSPKYIFTLFFPKITLETPDPPYHTKSHVYHCIIKTYFYPILSKNNPRVLRPAMIYCITTCITVSAKHNFTSFCPKIPSGPLSRHVIRYYCINKTHFKTILSKKIPLRPRACHITLYYQLYHCIIKTYFYSILSKNTLGILAPPH